MSARHTLSRRRFCALAAALAAAPALGLSARTRDDATQPSCGAWRATVVRCGCDPELQSALLADPEAGPCPRFRPGQTISFVPGTPPPAGVCPAAWAALGAATSGLCSQAAAGIAVSCPDATRPVTFILSPA